MSDPTPTAKSTATTAGASAADVAAKGTASGDAAIAESAKTTESAKGAKSGKAARTSSRVPLIGTTPRSRWLAIVTYLSVVAGVLFVLSFGTDFLFNPETTAPTFGLAEWPAGDGGGFLRVKGDRDVGLALILLILLVTRHMRALGWAMIAASFMPFADATIIFLNHGSIAIALSVHLATAVAVLATGIAMVVNEAPRKTGEKTPAANAV